MNTDFEELGLLEGVAGERERAARLALLRELSLAGVPTAELRRAAAESRLPLLAVELALSPDPPRYTIADVAERSGLEPEFVERLFRAQGRPRAEPGDRVYDDADVEGAIDIKRIRDAGLPDEGILDMARVMGSGMAALATTSGLVFGAAFLRAGDSEYDLALRYAKRARELTPLLEHGLARALRVHLRAAARQFAVGSSERATGRLPGAADVSVAFADLTGFTRLGESIPAEELVALAGRFATLAADLTLPPVRLVKTIGDAAMLVSRDADALLSTSLDMLDAVEAEGSELPPIHAGVAHGPALAHGGDWYGSAVNQASRVAQFARAGSVVASERVREAATGDYAWSFAGRRRLKGLPEPVGLFRVRRPVEG